jgi:hypothetical protein
MTGFGHADAWKRSRLNFYVSRYQNSCHCSKRRPWISKLLTVHVPNEGVLIVNSMTSCHNTNSRLKLHSFVCYLHHTDHMKELFNKRFILPKTYHATRLQKSSWKARGLYSRHKTAMFVLVMTSHKIPRWGCIHRHDVRTFKLSFTNIHRIVCITFMIGGVCLRTGCRGEYCEKVVGDWRRLHNEELHNMYA